MLNPPCLKSLSRRLASRVADMINRATATTKYTRSVAPLSATGTILQRKCACGNKKSAVGECEGCAGKKGILQRRPANEATGSEVPPIVHDVLRSPGQPLDTSTRAFMEPRFGHDFSHVRVHTDAKAAESARSVNALAYTVGRNMVFGREQYTPGTRSGAQLMAHELTHVIQQEGGHPGGSISIGLDGDRFEKEANQVADQIRDINTVQDLSNSRDLHIQRSPLRLQRLGANPGCTDPERRTIHQAIFNVRGWLNKAIPQLEASPLSSLALSSLRRNFGPTYGVSENAALIVGRLRAAYREISTIPFRCVGAADATCATLPCGYADAGAGGHSATICTNVTLTAGRDWRYQAGCVLHESLHAAFSRFTVDEYSGWHGASSSTATYPGAGTDPLLNADSYTTLAMDLS